MGERMRNLLLAACALPAALALAAPTYAAPQPADGYSDRLARLPELQRYAALRAALASSGQTCRRVASAARTGTMRNLAMWTVRCTPVGEYGVFLGPDGSVQVRTCSDLVKLRLPACGPTPRPAAATPPARRPR
jgi:hypothetical protein